MRTTPNVSVVALLALTAACSGEPESEPEAAPAPAPAAVAAPGPDTTGAAMWAHIQGESYQDDWELWPGMGELYQGNDPHGALLSTYANGAALAALNAGAVMMPDGAVLIKENYMPDSTLAAVTVMYKRTGYNAEHNDWFFAKFLPDGALDQMPNGMAMEGRLPGCQGCHIAKADADYLYTPRPGGE